MVASGRPVNTSSTVLVGGGDIGDRGRAAGRGRRQTEWHGATSIGRVYPTRPSIARARLLMHCKCIILQLMDNDAPALAAVIGARVKSERQARG